MKAKIVISSLIMVLMIAGLPSSNTSQQTNASEVISKFENNFPILTAKGTLLGKTTTLAERMEHHYVPGVSIAVINNFEFDWAKGYGVLDSEESQPVTPETLFPPASIGKTLTAVAAMHYVELGILNLDQNVNDLLTSWKISENEFTTHEDVTLRRLLSHTAGVSQSGFKGYLQGEELPTLTQLLDGEPPANNQPILVDTVPGAQWQYSGGGYQIVEQLLIDITDESFPKIIQESILGPLEMSSTTYAAEPTEELRPNTASAHSHWGQPIVGKWLNAPYMGAGAAWTTPTDLAKFANEIMLSITDQSNLLLYHEMANLMITPQAEGIPFMGPLTMDWGLGWQLNELLGVQLISHGGDIPEGYQNLLVMIPERGWGAVIFTNGANGDVLRMEILYTLAVQYGILPSLTRITWLGYLLLLLLSLFIVWTSILLIRRGRLRKSAILEDGKKTSITQVLKMPTVITIVVVSILFYASMAVGFSVDGGHTDLSPGQVDAQGLIEQSILLGQHGRIEEALETFTEAETLDPELELSDNSWNDLCILGSLWGHATEIMNICERAVVSAADSRRMYFGSGLARALTNDYDGAIADFEVYVEWTKDNGFYDPYGLEIEGFIIDLEAGKNPFDDAQLNKWK
jgi:CubicO group peptidase (beta-lactamase class C family)